MKHFHDPEAKKKLLARMRRIEGQVGAVCRMVEEEQYCVDILLQMSAAQGALGKASQVLLGAHVETCVADAMASGTQKTRQDAVSELMEVFSRYGGIGRR